MLICKQDARRQKIILLSIALFAANTTTIAKYQSLISIIYYY
jgi:hypothetical protein